MIADGLHLLLNFPDLGCAAADAPRNIIKSKYENKKSKELFDTKTVECLEKEL